MAIRTRDDQAPPDTSHDKAGVFVSYAREDEGIVERLSAALKANGRHVWVDTDNIRATEEWERAIDAGIDSADAVVFALSPAFLRSVQCRRELEYAVHKGKRLVPLLAREVDPADVPPELARLNWITIGAVDPAAVAALEDALDTDLDWVRAHTDLIVRAVAWEAKNEDRGLLLRGRPLADAERFLATASGKEPAPAPLHIRYVLAGRRAATRRQRGTIAVVTTFLIVAVALAVLALVQRNRAVHEANIARSRELAGSSTAVASSDPELARLLAVEAMDTEQTPEAVAALRRAVAQPTLRLHTKPKTTVVALSPDGGRVVLRRPNDTLEVLDLASGRRVASGRVEGTSHTAQVAFASGARRLAATTETGDAILWDLEQERRRRVQGKFRTLAFSQDGSDLLLVGRTGSVAIVDPRSGERRVTLAASAGDSSVFPGVPTAAFAPRGDLVVTWNEDSSRAQVWDARTGALRSTLHHGANITDAGISPGGDLALTAGRDMTIRFWDPTTGAQEGPVITVPAAEDDEFDIDIAAASFSPQSSAVVTTLTQDHLQVWHTRSAELQLNLPNQFDYLTDQGFGPVAPYLVTGSGIHDWVHDRKVVAPPMRVAQVHADGSFESVERLGDRSRVWSGQTEATLINLEHSASDVSSASGRVAVGYTDGTAEVRDARSGRALLRVPGNDSEPVGVELSPDGLTVAVSRRVDVKGQGGVELWSVGSGERRSLDASVIAAVGFSADATRLLVFTNTGAGAFAVIDTKTGDSIGETFPPRTVLIDSTALSPDGQLFVQPTADNTIEVYRVADGRRNGRPLRAPIAADVAVSPDNKRLASGGDGGITIIWDLDSGQRVATLHAHEAAVTRVAFSPDGRLLLTRSADGTLRVWEATTGAPVATWSDLPKAIQRPAELDAPLVADLGLDFSASGDEVLRADADYVYRIPCPACAEPDELLARARMETRRSLTDAERRQYLHEGE